MKNLRFLYQFILLFLLVGHSKAQSFFSLGDSLRISWHDLNRQKKSFLFPVSKKTPYYTLDFGYNPKYQLFYHNNNQPNRYSYIEYLNSKQYTTLTTQLSLKNNWNSAYFSPQLPSQSQQQYIKPIILNSPAFEKVFGGNRIEIIPKGSVDLSIMAQRNTNENPLLNERHRNLWGIDFDQNFNLNLVGKIGEKGRVFANFSSKAEFDFENQIKFEYRGNPNDILQLLEIGNINFATRSQFMGTAEELFGIRTQLKVGKINFTGVLSQKNSDNHQIIITNGKAQRELNISLSDYEANQHYFLGHYFRDNYNKSLQTIPYINSPIEITNIEVWINNRTNKTEGSRDILALLDLGEKKPFNNNINSNTTAVFPNSVAAISTVSNNLMELLGENGRNPNTNFVQSFFSNNGATDNYAKLSNAQKLVEGKDYTVHRKLGYISLNFPLNQDQVLAVSYRFIANGKEYQVGDLSTDLPFNPNQPLALYTKLLKNEIVNTELPTWDLMMKNIYSLGGNNFSEQDIKLQIVREDTRNATHNSVMYEGQQTSNKTWLQLTGLDRLAQNNYPGADGLLDFIDGVNLDNLRGKLIFPYVEPLGKDLENLFTPSEASLKEKYIFPELYTLTQATAKREYSYKDRYKLKGTIQSQNASEYQLGIFNLKPNSIKVYASGLILQENIDYAIDYEVGTLRILNEALLLSNNMLKISIEDQGLYGKQQKTFVGGRLDYTVNKKLLLGATFMHLSERPFTEKVQIGAESISNNMLGADINYSTNSRWLTRMVDKLPFYKTDEESSINFYGEIAHSKPGYAKAINNSNSRGVAYLDDFEQNFSYINIKNQQGWQISGTPQLFPEYILSNDLAYGFNRAHLAFYNIDPIFYQSSSLNPNIDSKFLIDHRTRRVTEQEVFPFKEIKTGTDAFLPTLDLAFYPKLRGPYNFSTSAIDSEGKLLQPKSRWAGISKKLEQTDFETNNIEYLEMWMMDPELTSSHQEGGDLYINLGNISEDILKDGRKSVENAIAASGDKSNLDKTAWGYSSKVHPITNVFENSDISRQYQDVGLDGLSNHEEKEFHSAFLNQMRNILTPYAFEKLAQDPSSDDFNYYRGSQFSKDHGILERYLFINGTEGNSKTQNQSLQAYGIENGMRTLLPDAEDISRDNTMNEADNYYQYRISLHPEDMAVGKNYIVDAHTTQAIVLNRKKEVKWYKFRIPIREFGNKYGNIHDFKSIRFIRLFLTNFSDTTVLRFAQLQFVKSDWRLYNPNNNAQWVIAEPELGQTPPTDQSKIEIANINIEENGKRSPIPYVVPPNITRQLDYTNNNLDVQMNEQSLSLKLQDLKDGYGRAAFKNASYNLLPYKNIEFFVHAEGETLNDGDANAFIRLGTDDKQHYYEFEAPLKVTPPGSSSPEVIWPSANNMVVNLDILREAKIARDNASKNGQSWPLDEPFEWYIGKNKITIKGAPDLSNIKFYMLGVKNPLNSKNTVNALDDGRSITGEFWFNELRVTDFENKSHWAATTQLHVKLADLANISLSGTKMSAGFGDISQRISQQNRNERFTFDFTTNAELGKFINPKFAISIPLYFNYSRQISTPEFNPFQGDILLKKTWEDLSDQRKDSLLRIIQDITLRKNFSIINARKLFIDTDKKVKPWNIENFSFSYMYNEYLHRDLYTENSLQKNYRGAIDYNYNNPNIVFRKPFKTGMFFKQFNYNLAPTLLSFRLEVNRIYQENTFRDNASSNILPTYYNKNLNTNRIYGISWDLTKSLRMDFNATNYAIIDEPNGRLDGARKDTLWNNFWRLGSNMNYNHMLNFTYTLPLNKIPYLEWINITSRYGSQFNWKSEPLNLLKTENMDLGNSIQNNRTIQLNPTLNFNTLYHKLRFYRENTKSNENNFTSHLLRLFTGIKNINAAYTKIEGTFLPGYIPNSNMLGYSFSQNAPGFDFILGGQVDILQRAVNNNWLTNDSTQNSSYTKSYSENLSAVAYTEPIKGLRLDLTFTRLNNRNKSLPFLSITENLFYETGSYSISQMALRISFRNPYTLFQQFESLKQPISELLGSYNPNSTGISSDYFADGYNQNQQDVVLNAFMKTYLNKNFMFDRPNKPTFPLPNWRLNYTGLTQLLGIEDIVRSIHINHTYQSQYSIGGYFTNVQYKMEENFPFVRDRNKNFLPPQQYSQISLTDRFLPMIGVDLRFDNNLSISAEYRKIRDIALSLENSQLSTLDDKSYISGIGYRKLNTRMPFGIFANRNWKNDLNFRVDFALNDRKLFMYRTGIYYEEITGGNKSLTINPTLDYTINKFYNVRLFYNSNAVRPYTSQSFATSYTYFGFSLKILFQ